MSKREFRVTLSVDKKTGEPTLVVAHDEKDVDVTWMAVRDIRINRASCTIEAASFEAGFGPAELGTTGPRVKAVHYRATPPGSVETRTACGLRAEDLLNTEDSIVMSEADTTCIACCRKLR